MDTNQTTQVDPTALALSRAIRSAEGGKYDDVSGDNGTSAGAYQFNNGKVPLKKGEIPANFKSWATEVGLDPNDFSQTNQDHVAYERIKRKLDAGQSQSSIAAEWNSGLKNNWENHKGSTTINGKPITYDTPAYVDKVKNYYLKNVSGAGDTSTEDLTKDKMVDITPPNNPTYTSAPHSPERLAQYQAEAKDANQQSKDANSVGGILGDTVKNIGDNLTFGGATTLGDQLGTGLSKTYNQAKGLVGLQDNSKYMEDMSPLKTALGLTGTLGGILATASPELKGILSKGGELASSGIQTILREGSNLLPKEATGTLTKETAEEILKEKLNNLTIDEVKGKLGQSILKALQELNPSIVKNSGFLSKLATAGKGLGLVTAGGLATELLGNKVGGAVKGLVSSL